VKPLLRLVAAVLSAVALAGIPSAMAASAAQPVLTVTTVAGNGLKAESVLKLTGTGLAALQQTSETVTIGGQKLAEKGPPLTEVIAKAGLRSSTSCDDETLRYWFEVTNGAGEAVVVASAEVDPDGGDKLALLSLSENGAPLAAPRLIIVGDRTGARDIMSVTGITIGRVAPQLSSTTPGCNPPGFKPAVTISSAPADIGAVIVNGVVPRQTIAFPQIEALPQVTQVDTYTGEGEQKVHREHGPTLYDFLVKADPALKSLGQQALRYYVEATSSEDGSVAVVSWAEIDPTLDGKPFLLSTYEDGDLILNTDSGPRLTAPGDAGGSRYDYGVQVVTVFRTP
jgi:hypothetical protein